MPNTNRLSSLVVLLLLSMLLLSPVASIAENDAVEESTTDDEVREEDLEEKITVFARQVEEVLEDVPATVSVITDDQIQAIGIRRAEDFLKVVPGVTAVNAAEVGDMQVNIRGINGSRDAENSFAFIVDGILMTNPAAFNREFANISQIEVMKGPQGAHYGRNAAAGAVIVSTARPSATEFEGVVKLSAGEDSTNFADITIGGPIGGTGASYSLHADFGQTDGFYTNTFLNDKVVDDFEQTNLEGRLLFQTGDGATDWDFKARWGEVEAAAITFNANFSLPTFVNAFGFPIPEFDEDVNDHNFVFQANIDPFNEQEQIQLSGLVQHRMDWGNLRAWALYSDIENAFWADGTSGSFGFFNNEPNCINSTAALFNQGVMLPSPQFLAPQPALSIFGPYTPTTCDGTQYQVRNQEDLSFEARLTGDASDKAWWQVGAYFLTLDREVGVNLGIDQGQGVVPQLFVPQNGANPTEQLVHDDFETDVWAVFGALQYDVNETWNVSGALRYDSEDRSVTNLVPTAPRTQYVDFTLDGMFTGGAPLNPGLDPTINPGGTIEPKSETFDQLQPKLSVTWHASDATTVYGSWGVGFKSGGFNNQGSNATVDIFFNQPLGTDLLILDQFEEETSSAFELGFKSRPNRGLYWEGAIYRTDVDDMQFFEFLVGPFGLLRVVSNIDEVEIQGVELGFNWQATNALRLYAGGNWIDSEIIANSSRPDTVGNKSPYTPDYSGNLSLEYNRPISDNWIFAASGYLTFVGETWFHTVQDQTNVTLFNLLFPGAGIADYSKSSRDPYEILDLRFGVASERWTFNVWVNNVTDESVLEEVITAPEFGGSFIHPKGLRRAGVEVGVRF